MTGYLRGVKGVRASEGRVGAALRELNPNASNRRAETAGRSLNPKTYRADYFGHKIHIDQNEKLAMYVFLYSIHKYTYSMLNIYNVFFFVYLQISEWYILIFAAE